MDDPKIQTIFLLEHQCMPLDGWKKDHNKWASVKRYMLYSKDLYFSCLYSPKEPTILPILLSLQIGSLIHPITDSLECLVENEMFSYNE